MRKSLFNCAAALSFAATASAAAAQSVNQTCLNPEEMRGLAGFVLPAALDTTIEFCDGHLAPGGYLTRHGERLSVRFAAGQDADWPGARSAFVKLFANQQPGIASLPDDMLRSLVEIGVSSQLATQIKPENCGAIERFAESLDPLPRANLVSLLAQLLPMIGQPERRVRACPAN